MKPKLKHYYEYYEIDWYLQDKYKIKLHIDDFADYFGTNRYQIATIEKQHLHPENTENNDLREVFNILFADLAINNQVPIRLDW